MAPKQESMLTRAAHTASTLNASLGEGTCARTLVLGLGNAIVRDDAIGILVAREVKEMLRGRADVVVREASLAGFDLLDLLVDFHRAIVIDAIKTPGGNPGTLYRLQPQDLPVPKRLMALHEIDLPTALMLGRVMGQTMPDEVVIYAVEVEDDCALGEALSPSVRQVLKTAASVVAHEAVSHRGRQQCASPHDSSSARGGKTAPFAAATDVSKEPAAKDPWMPG